MKVTYDSNNSGGDWWLEDKDWFALQDAGWNVEWLKDDPDARMWTGPDGRFLGALSMKATIETDSISSAVASWTAVTGQDPDDDGCECCGPPHNFYTGLD